ncbi:hypothetical protein ACMYR2_0456 [Nitrobacter sp. TKz-YC01]
MTSSPRPRLAARGSASRSRSGAAINSSLHSLPSFLAPLPLPNNKNVRRNHNAAQIPSSNRPAELRKNILCDGPILLEPVPQPPAPRGHQDRAYSQRSILDLQKARTRCRAFLFEHPEGRPFIARDSRRGKRQSNINAAGCRPRQASGRAFRDCHPEHRPPRHRRHDGRYSQSAPPRCPPCPSSRRP